METSRHPPAWLQGWRYLVRQIFAAEMIFAKFMVQTVRLGLRSRSWLAHQDPTRQEMAESVILEAGKPCSHPPEQMVRHGNQYGRFCRCVQCRTKWRLNDKEAGSQRPPLPRPSETSSVRPAWAKQVLPERDPRATSSATSSFLSAQAKTKAKSKPREGYSGEQQADGASRGGRGQRLRLVYMDSLPCNLLIRPSTSTFLSSRACVHSNMPTRSLSLCLCWSAGRTRCGLCSIRT